MSKRSPEKLTKPRPQADLQPWVKAVLMLAHQAAEQAAAHYVQNAQMTAEGFVADSCGSAVVWVHKPSYHFRETLKALGEIDRWHGGMWSNIHFPRKMPKAANQSYWAHNAACEAAAKVLSASFPNEKFSIHAWVD